MSGFCLISQSPKRLSHYFHNLLWLASQGMWRLKPAKTTSVFFSLILALLRRRGGRKKKSINRVEEGSKEGEKKFLTLTVFGEAEQRPRRPSEAAARLSAHRGPKSRWDWGCFSRIFQVLMVPNAIAEEEASDRSSKGPLLGDLPTTQRLSRNSSTKSFLACHFMVIQLLASILFIVWEVDDGINNLTLFFLLYTVFENHRKSLIQHCERSELRLHFEWTKVN